VKYLKETISYT